MGKKSNSKESNKNISATLATATYALLGGAIPEPVQAQEETGWDFNTSLLYYGEDANRVEDLSVSVLARRTFMDDRSLTMGLTVDALTGATPHGGLHQAVPQTFTSPSGNNVYTTPANTLPLDDSFLDTRVAVSANWQQPLGRLYNLNVGFSGSKEYDYCTLGRMPGFPAISINAIRPCPLVWRFRPIPLNRLAGLPYRLRPWGMLTT